MGENPNSSNKYQAQGRKKNNCNIILSLDFTLTISSSSEAQKKHIILFRSPGGIYTM